MRESLGRMRKSSDKGLKQFLFFFIFFSLTDGRLYANTKRTAEMGIKFGKLGIRIGRGFAGSSEMTRKKQSE